MTTVHTSTAAIGCSVLLWRGHFHLTKLTTRENLILLGFSVLYTVNIAISNVSLCVYPQLGPNVSDIIYILAYTDTLEREMVSVSFHQIMRSTTPIFTILIYRLWYSRSYAMATYLSLIPIVLGVALTTLGDYYFTPLGFILTTLGVLLAALKTVATNRLMTGGLKLHALELLFRMSPLAAAQSFIYALMLGEFRGFFNWVAEGNLGSSYASALAGNGMLAFLLNIASLHTNKLAGALTMTICANLKQCLTVILGIVLFDTKIGIWSGYGMVITLVGAAVYSKVELEMKAMASQNPTTLTVADLPQERSKKGDLT